MRLKGFIVGSDDCRLLGDQKSSSSPLSRINLMTRWPKLLPLVADRRVVISVVTGVHTKRIARRIGGGVRVVRAMPNTAIAVRESMTCLASSDADNEGIDIAKAVFDTVGKTIVVAEDDMIAATALGACGVAFFLRAVGQVTGRNRDRISFGRRLGDCRADREGPPHYCLPANSILSMRSTR